MEFIVDQTPLLRVPRRVAGLSLLSMVVLASFALTGCAQKLTREDWLRNFLPAMTVKACQPGWYFRGCFDISDDECETTTASALRVCVAEVREEMPEYMTGSTGKEWGQKIGTCAGNSLDVVFHDRKLEKEMCKDPSAWR